MSRTVASSLRFADALALALVGHTPDGLVVQAEGSSVLVKDGGASWAGSAAPAILEDPEPLEPSEDARLLETVARSTLSGIQDAISRAWAKPWPSAPGDPSVMPPPGARVVEGVLHLWFGDEEAPALRLEPMLLDALGL